jgi:hypothetical protein
VAAPAPAVVRGGFMTSLIPLGGRAVAVMYLPAGYFCGTYSGGASPP